MNTGFITSSGGIASGKGSIVHAGPSAKVTMTSTIDVGALTDALEDRIAMGVQATVDAAYEVALKEVPIRKVFARGRTRAGRAFGGRQEVRTLSLPEARAESYLRKKFGLASAFSGHKVVVKTALFPGNYRTHHRPNDFNQPHKAGQRPDFRRVVFRQRVEFEDAGGRTRNRIVNRLLAEGGDFRLAGGPESDLSSRGRYELRKGRAISGNPKGVETLGGALHRTVENWPHQVERGASRFEGRVGAGGGKVDYAKYVEFGTHHARAQPFLRPALAHARTRFRNDLTNAIRGVR